MRGEVLWGSKSQELIATAFDKKIEFIFNFENKGKYPIELSKPSASCVCTLPALAKTHYDPGEKGVLRGFININGMNELSAAKIYVKWEEIDGDIRRPFEETLELKVIIQEIVTVVPSITLWRKDGDSSEKGVRLEVKQAADLPLKLVGCDSDAFTVKLTETVPGRAYDLKVSPVSAKNSAQGIVTIEAVAADGKTLKFFAHLLVR